MMRVCKILILLVLCAFTVIGQAQEDSVKTDTVRVMDNNPYRFRIRQVFDWSGDYRVGKPLAAISEPGVT